MTKKHQVIIKGRAITFFSARDDDYISLTDMAKFKNREDPRYVIQNWMKTRASVEFLGLWESINNMQFNRVEFDTVKNESGSNAFVLTPKRWIETTNAIGIISKAGRYGGTYAHKDIAFEFASWISAEFKLYLIKEFQRLKQEEDERMAIGWDAKRMLAKVNYKVHTDAVKEKLIPPHLSKSQSKRIYANEADVLNVALYGLTAREWRKKNSKKKGNIRDHSNVVQLVCLAGLESLNAEFIRQCLTQRERLIRLNEIAIIQMKSLIGSKEKFKKPLQAKKTKISVRSKS